MSVREGMSAAEARAMCAELICIEQDAPADRRALIALGRWMMRFTPDVSCGWEDVECDTGLRPVVSGNTTGRRPVPRGGSDHTPAVLFLDLTGCERLFGGIEPIVQSIRRSLNQFCIPANIAVAPVPGAAWAFAFAGKSADQIITADSLRSAIENLPILSLRLDEEIAENLFQLGLHRVGDLLLISREQLLTRFGPMLLLRLDQLTGDRVEPLTKLVHTSPITAKMEFDAPIEAVEEIGLIFEKLLGLVLAELTRRNRGIRQMRMIFKPDRGWGRETVVRSIVLSRAHRDRNTLLALIRCELERVDCEHGFVLFKLDVPLHERVTEAQMQMFEPQFALEQMELDRLFQRLRARLGESAVIQPELVESYLPERAWKPGDVGWASPTGGQSPPYMPPRPLTLFPTPIEIRVICEPSDDRTGHPRQFTAGGHVHRLTQITGPERIAGEWWRGHHRTRDYYDVEDQTGKRFWIFRVLQVQHEEGKIISRWFWHGKYE